jgi:hypothetical protein
MLDLLFDCANLCVGVQHFAAYCVDQDVSDLFGENAFRRRCPVHGHTPNQLFANDWFGIARQRAVADFEGQPAVYRAPRTDRADDARIDM